MDYTQPIYLGIKKVIDRNTADILEQTDDCIFLQDTVSGAYILAADEALGKELLMRYEDRSYSLGGVSSQEFSCPFWRTYLKAGLY